MEIKNILNELEMWLKNQEKSIVELEHKLSLMKQDRDNVSKQLDSLLKPKEDNGTTISK